MENFVLTITFLCIGIALKQLPDFPKNTGKVLNLFVIYISLPALVFINIPDLHFSTDIFVPAVMPWLLLILSAGLIFFLSRMYKWERGTTGCLMLLIPLGNTSFFGIPMVKTFFGDSAISYALLYDQLGSFFALAIYGSIILAVYSTGENRPTVLSILKNIFTFPPFIALILAFVLKPYSYPEIAISLLQTLAATLVPLVMVAVGFQLKLQLDRKTTSQLCFGLSIKLIAAPLAALLFCMLTGLTGEAVQVSIFEAGMPPMVSAGALAIAANLAPGLAAALVGVGIVVSFATLPILHQLLVLYA